MFYFTNTICNSGGNWFLLLEFSIHFAYKFIDRFNTLFNISIERKVKYPYNYQHYYVFVVLMSYYYIILCIFFVNLVIEFYVIF